MSKPTAQHRNQELERKHPRSLRQRRPIQFWDSTAATCCASSVATRTCACNSARRWSIGESHLVPRWTLDFPMDRLLAPC
jgi:hypothetical protein